MIGDRFMILLHFAKLFTMERLLSMILRIVAKLEEIKSVYIYYMALTLVLMQAI
jgi:hypothetical protein